MKPVYPRVGGGTRGRVVAVPPAVGLSPRGRGNRSGPVRCCRTLRSIPAWAGEPRSPRIPIRPRRVYPRVGGGTYNRDYGQRLTFGLSPRGRGNPFTRSPDISNVGSIPAWAGEPGWTGGPGLSPWVYPRVGGGTVAPSRSPGPRLGLSPRGRGNRGRRPAHPARWRSIPAWAGEPTDGTAWACGLRVYPRVGGGTSSRSAGATSMTGLSPRGRGNHPWPGPPATACGSIPAWAGEPPSPGQRTLLIRVYPRVGGGTLRQSRGQPLGLGLSPRGRGNPRPCRRTTTRPGSIPAWAREPG